QPFAGFLQQVRDTTLQAYKHQDVPFEKVVDALEVARDRTRTALFQIVFVLQNQPDSGKLSLGSSELSGAGTGAVSSEFDMTLDVVESSEGLLLNLVYRKALYREETVNLLLDHYEELLRQVVADRTVAVDQLSLLTAAEEERLEQFSGSGEWRYEHPEATVAELFEEQAALRPQTIALVTTYEQLTY